MAILQARTIEKHFTDGRETIPVLRGIDFEVERGEIVSLEGPSGSGKTTFLSILGCILTPSSGDVIVDGRHVNADGRTLADIRKRSLGFVFQQFNLFPSLSAIENVEYALNVKGVRGEAAHTEARRVIDAVGLSERRDFLPRDLSGGQKQRVAIARALAGSAPILLADEPTANLDSVTGERIIDLMKEMNQRDGTTFIFSTHDAKVMAHADAIVRLADGKIVARELAGGAVAASGGH